MYGMCEHVCPWLCVCEDFIKAALVIILWNVLVEDVVIGHLSSAVFYYAFAVRLVPC